MTRQSAGTALLVAGYALAVGAAPLLPRAIRHRRAAAFITFEAATGAVVVGWALRDRWAPAIVNAVILTGLAATWLTRSRRR